jgi:hypothetical protein
MEVKPNSKRNDEIRMTNKKKKMEDKSQNLKVKTQNHNSKVKTELSYEMNLKNVLLPDNRIPKIEINDET